MAPWAARFASVHVDFGTGDGAFVRWVAAHRPDQGVIGVDASADGLRPLSRRLAAKPARGGLPNALFGRLSLDDAPGELAGLADQLTVLLPWGSLLETVARPDTVGLAKLRALCKRGAAVRVVFGYGPDADGGAINSLALPPLDLPETARMLEERYLGAGLHVAVRSLGLDEVRAIPTTWAKRLAFSGRQRRFVELAGHATQ